MSTTKEKKAKGGEKQQLVPPTGIIPLMRKLVARGRSQKRVLRAGRRRYEGTGYSSEQIEKRIQICYEMALKEEQTMKDKKKGKKTEKVEKSEGTKTKTKSKKGKEKEPSAGKVDKSKGKSITKKKSKKSKASDEEE